MEDWINDGEESLMIRKRVKNMNDDDGEGEEIAKYRESLGYLDAGED